MKILVAEDNPHSLYLLEQYFAGRGHSVWPAPNGRAALDLITTNGLPDIVVSDALMPVMDGFEFCSAIRRDPKLHKLPFILYTATYTAESDERYALSIGVDRYVVKPIEPDKLLGVVEEVAREADSRPPREIIQNQLEREQLQEYTRMVLVKLEDKLEELSNANAALSRSEEAVRTLNEKLIATIRRLENEVDGHRRSNELLRMAQNAGGIGCWETSGNGEVHWRGDAYSILGYTKSGASDSFADFLAHVVPEDRKRAEAAFVTLLDATSLTFELEVRFQGDGASRPKHLLLRGARSPVKPSKNPRWLGIVQDITGRKDAELRRQLLEQQLFRSQKMEALGNLAGGIAHDFNNILTAILGNVELLKSGLLHSKPADPYETPLQEISNAAQRARDIIKQILTFSRRQPIERQPVLFSKVVEDALQLARSTIGKNNRVLVSCNTDRWVSANEGQIQQILLNLCTNAAQAMAPRGGTISIALSAVEVEQSPENTRPPLKRGPYLRLTVGDNGPGMEPSVLEHIFEPFFTTKTSGEGTGLGLAVVHGIMDAHEGSIGVESKPGAGTTFSLYFPAVAPGAAAPLRPCLAAAVGKGAGQRILVVDDEPSVARTCQQLLQQMNYEAASATDPVEARELFESHKQSFDAVILDFLMPRMTGLDLARTLWSLRPGLPVVLMAGFGTQMDASRARAEGFVAFLTKPFTAASLCASLELALPRTAETSVAPPPA